jgi:hypothetical protein
MTLASPRQGICHPRAEFRYFVKEPAIQAVPHVLQGAPRALVGQHAVRRQAGLILGKGGRPKKPTTIVTDTGRIERHIIPLIGTRRVKDLTKADINKVLKPEDAKNTPNGFRSFIQSEIDRWVPLIHKAGLTID